MLQFIPLTDEDLERDPSLYFRLVPFNLDYPCRRLEEEPLDDAQRVNAVPGELGAPVGTSKSHVPAGLLCPVGYGLDVHVLDGPERESPTCPDQFRGDFRAVVNE